MSNSKILPPLGKAVATSANALGTLQVGIDKVLWGSNTPTTRATATYNVKSGSLDYTTVPNTPTPPAKNAVGSFVQSGLFNALDALNSVDLCNVLSYLTDMVPTVTKKKRPQKPWTAAQTALYSLQDAAAQVQTQIDKYTAYPNVFIGSYIGTGPNAVPINQAVSQSGAPKEGGTQVTAYNTYFLMQAIKDSFDLSGQSTGSIFNAEDATLLSTVPGIGGNLNFIDDFIGVINKYSDYRNIPNDELQKIITQINQVRSVCVTIQNLDFQNALALAGNFLSTDIRAQIQRLSAFLNPTGIIKELKEINNSLRAFIRIAQQVQGILSLGQFLIKLALVFNKIFEFVQQFILNSPLPASLQTTGTISRLEKARIRAKDETDGVSLLLKTINTLLSVAVNFIRYILANTNELLGRLNTLLLNLQTCEAVKNSDVIAQLQETRDSLVALQEQFTAYITQYDSKVDPSSMMFGEYDIRVVDEELTDKTITNKRRRGIALDTNGQIVAQSDLTFATNTSVIIAEVQHKLMAIGLVKSSVGLIDAATLDTIATSINYLDSNDVAENDLNIGKSARDSASTAQALNINEFIGKTPGGQKFKQRSNEIMDAYNADAKQQVSGQKTSPGGGSSAENTQYTDKTGYNNTGLNSQDARRLR